MISPLLSDPKSSLFWITQKGADHYLGDGKHRSFDESEDPAPKPIMRHAAMVQYL